MSKMLLIAGMLAAAVVPAWAGDDKETEEALKTFRKAMSNPSAPARASAVTELAATKSEKVAATLGGLVQSDAEPVRIAAAEGLGGFKDFKKVATPMLLAGLNANAKEEKVMAAIFKGLGKLDDDSALPTIHRYFEDKVSEVASAALLAAGEIRNTKSIDPILDLMRKYEKIDKQAAGGDTGGYGGINVPGGGDDPKRKLAKEVLPSTIKAMQAITKEKWATVKEWEIWWGRYKASFKIDK